MKTKRFISITIVLALLLAAPLFARDRVFDNAGLLSTSEKTTLEQRMEEISSTYNFELVIVTEEDIGSTLLYRYADDFIDANGFGTLNDVSILLQVTAERDYDLGAYGRGKKILNNTAFNKLEKDVVRHLKNDDYNRAYNTFVSVWEEFLILEAKGRSHNFFLANHTTLIIVAWVIALFVALGIVKAWKMQMNTARLKTEADLYITPGSLSFTQKQDNFLYSTVTKKEKPRESSSSSSSGSSGSHRSGKY